MKIIKKFWQKAWWSKLILLIVGFFFIFAIIGIFSPTGQKSFNEGLEAGRKAALPLSSSTPTIILTQTPTPNPSPTPEVFSPTLTPLPSLSTPTPVRKIIKGSTPKGEEFYDKVNMLHKQGKVYGELYTEFESDPIVDVNPDTQSVQLGLKYSSITDSIDEEDKKMILSDFKTIKALAEQDKSLVIPDYGTLRLFVLTFLDKSGKGRGDLQQMMIDEEPSWSFWD